MEARQPPGAPSHGSVPLTVTVCDVVEKRMRRLPWKTVPLTWSGSAQTFPLSATSSELYS